MLSLTSPATSINTLGANRAAHRQKRELERGAAKTVSQLPFHVVGLDSGFICCQFCWRSVDFVFPVGEKEASSLQICVSQLKVWDVT